jgi:hypothetical protein
MKVFNVCGVFEISEDFILLDKTISEEDLKKIKSLSISESCYISFGLTKNGKITRIK